MRTPAITALVLLGLAATSCGGGTDRATNGPLGTTGEPGTLCMNPPDGRTVTVGLDALRPDADVQVESVELVDADGVELLGAALVPITGSDLYGSFNSFPPSLDDIGERSFDWDARIDASGAEIAAGSQWNLLVGLGADEGGGKTSAFRIEYESDGDPYVLVTSTAIEVRLPPESCT